MALTSINTYNFLGAYVCERRNRNARGGWYAEMARLQSVGTEEVVFAERVAVRAVLRAEPNARADIDAHSEIHVAFGRGKRASDIGEEVFSISHWICNPSRFPDELCVR